MSIYACSDVAMAFLPPAYEAPSIISATYRHLASGM
jgi:hypothetical protein